MPTRLLRWLSALGCLFAYNASIYSAVLPEDRADILYHSYDGGGVQINGPSVLVRKKFGESFSASVNHYVDNVSSASIDVLTSASPYTENRKENSLAVDYLHEKTTMTLGITNSLESDFDATTISINLAQDMFGDLTTVTMGYAEGDNIVGRNGDNNFSETATAKNYRLGLTQIVSKTMVMALAFELITDQGFLNNPYRSVRYLNATGTQYLFQQEVYPGTRTSNAFAWRFKYFLQPRSAIHGGYRFFSDSWGISSHTVELGYTLPYQSGWILETSVRFYEQTSADFYSDLFPFQDAQNFLARDKELSSFNSITIGAGATYEFSNSKWQAIKRGSLNFHYDYINFNYQDFRDITTSLDIGNEPLYQFNAGVIRAYASIWF